MPLIEPLTVDQVKIQARIKDTASDALLGSYITAARSWVEGETGHALVQRSFTEYRPAFGDFLELYRTPVVSVEGVAYFDPAGEVADLSAWTPALNITPARVYPAAGAAFPPIAAGSEIAVAYTAGYMTGDEPPELLQAVAMLAAHWFNVREPVNGIATPVPVEIPFTVTALCELKRVPWL